MRNLMILLASLIPATLSAQQPPPSTATREEWVLLVNPRVPIDGPVSIAPQRFAVEADCKALSRQLHASVEGKCVKVTVIAP